MPEKTKKEAKKIHPPKEDGAILWETVTKDVRPLSKKELKTPQKAPQPRKTALKESAKKSPPVADRRSVKFAPAEHKSGKQMAASQKKRLKEGKIDIDARLDLHGMSAATAHKSLLQFIQSASDEHKRCLLVITGKGGGKGPNSGQGVLKKSLERWVMESNLAPKVLSITSAARHHGGEGAFYIYLRRKAR